MDLKYATMDVFTKNRYAGNPLAIVLLPTSKLLTQDQKQLIAREFNFSETVFVHEHESDRTEFQIDIFTTTTELPFAGHPTIGSAMFIKELHSDLVHTTLVTKAGKIPITYAEDLAQADIPHNVHIHSKQVTIQMIMEAQSGLKSVSLPKTYPVVSIVAGMTFVLVELPDLPSLGQVTTTSVEMSCELDAGWNESYIGVYYFVKTTNDSSMTTCIRARMIDRHLEDPATGSAASALASYLTLLDKSERSEMAFQIVQGVEMNRRSEIHVRIQKEVLRNRIHTLTLSGSAIIVAEGYLRI